MTIANGDTVLASDILAIGTVAAAASGAAATALANSMTALSNSGSAIATAGEAMAQASVALSITALPLAISVSPTDLVPVAHNGTNAAVTVNTFNLGLAGSIAAVGSVAAAALTAANNAGSAAASGLNIASLSTVTSAGTADLVPIDQAGSVVAISTANLLGGETANLLTAAGAVADTDVFPTAQAGGSTLTQQSAAALNTYLQGKLPSYKPPVTLVTGSTLALDGSTSNGAVFVVSSVGCVVSAGLGLGTSNIAFNCTILTVGSGTVTWGSGITASNGGAGLSTSSWADVVGIVWSGGTVVLAKVPGGTSGGSVSAPGPISGLTLGTVSTTTLAFSWTAPSTGGTPTYYQVQYRTPVGSGPWIAVSPNPTATSVVIGSGTALTAGTTYDVEVAAANTGGSSSFVVYGQSPAAATASSGSAPGVPTSLASGSITSSAITWSWVAPTGTPAATSYVVETSTDNATWSAPIAVSSGTSYQWTGLNPSTLYYLRVAAVAGGVTGSYTSGVSGTTLASGNYLLTPAPTRASPTIGWSGTAITMASGQPSGGYNLSDNSASGDGSHTVPAFVYFGWSTSNTVAPTSLNGAAGQVTLDGHNLWYSYTVTYPGSAGTYYLWGIAKNSGGSVVATCVSPTPFTLS